MKLGKLPQLVLGGLMAVSIASFATSASACTFGSGGSCNTPIFDPTGINIFGQDLNGQFTLLGSGSTVATFVGGFGNYNFVTTTGSGSPTGLFLTSTMSAGLSGSGSPDAIVNIFVQQNGMTNPSGMFNILSGFSLSSFVSGITLTESTYIDTSNAALSTSSNTLPGTTTLLASQTFTNGGGGSGQTVFGTVPSAITGPYTMTQEYSLQVTKSFVNPGNYPSLGGAITAQQVPEPLSMALLGTGLIGLTAVYRRRRHRA